MSNDNDIPIIGEPKPIGVKLELPATFSITLWFINHSGQYTNVQYSLPPGVYPNPKWLEKLIKDSYRESLTTLKMSTSDLSWRKPTPQEFVTATAGGANVKAFSKWVDAYSSEFTIEVPEVVKDDNAGA